MKWLRYISLIIGFYNLLLFLIYTTIGKATSTEIAEKGLMWIFYLVPPMYALISGLISLIAILIEIVILFVGRKQAGIKTCAIVIIINILYLIWYIKWISIQ